MKRNPFTTSTTDNNQPQQEISPSKDIHQPPGNGKDRKFLYILLAAVLVISIIGIGVYALLPKGTLDTGTLSVNYVIGEKMVYSSTNSVANQVGNQPIDTITGSPPTTYNSTTTYEVVGFDGETYRLNLTLFTKIQNSTFDLPAITTTVDKEEWYHDLLPSMAPQLFNNVSSNPTLEAVLANQVNVGDSWTFPVNTGNSSLGLTGELTLKFAEIQQITVPAGTYTALRIELTSSDLILNADPQYLNAIHLNLPNVSLRLTGKAYLEQGTCRLLKSELIQETTSLQAASTSKTVIYSEKVLIEHTKP